MQIINYRNTPATVLLEHRRNKLSVACNCKVYKINSLCIIASTINFSLCQSAKRKLISALVREQLQNQRQNQSQWTQRNIQEEEVIDLDEEEISIGSSVKWTRTCDTVAAYKFLQ